MDQKLEVLSGQQEVILDPPVLGLYHPTQKNAGRISLFGDSNCLDSAHMDTGMQLQFGFLSRRIDCIFGYGICFLRIHRISSKKRETMPAVFSYMQQVL